VTTWEAWPPARLVAEIREELGGAGSDLGLVLGSGLGGVAGRLERRWSRGAADLPGYPRSTVAGHDGKLLFGRLAGRDLWVVQGRAHLYEGYTPEEATRYLRLLHALGVRRLVLTNAAGSVDPAAAAPGEVLLCHDALNLFLRPLAPSSWPGPWRRREPLGDPAFGRLAREVARELGILLREGILVGSLGPSYETAAEVRLARRLGGTVASMSTVPEGLVARELGIRCVLFSLVTNFGTGLTLKPLDHEEVMAMGRLAGRDLERLIAGLAARL